MAEVAELLKLNQQTVRNWIDQGSLPALKVGRRVRIRRSDLERMLDQGRVKGNSSSGQEALSAEGFWGGEPVGLAEPVGSEGAEPLDPEASEGSLVPGESDGEGPASEDSNPEGPGSTKNGS